MYLSKLEIFGFKSFLQKTHLSFDEGITSIVGPNGCGKTNVVDAIRWVLGEQRPTTLRSDKMEDVIFNGTKSRKPLSMAEVSLTIENTRNILPTEYSEVTITRRVFRSGESEYYLNKTLCRLKDIRNLFMDTGMGSDAYSVIELKMVEEILSDNTDERRRLFEEAAGVTKYKHRRKEAYRRLESVTHDLERVSDVVREVQKAVNSLERQAKKAEKYNELARHLQELELELMNREYASIIGRIMPLEQQLAVAVTERNAIDVALEQEEALLEVNRSELREIEQRAGSAQLAIGKQQEVVHALEQSRSATVERRKAQEDNIVRFEQEKERLLARRTELERHREVQGTKLEALAGLIAQAAKAYEDRKLNLDAFAAQLDAKKNEQRAQQTAVVALIEEISELRRSEATSRARMENLQGRVELIAEERQKLQQEVAKNEGVVATLSAEDRELRRKFAEAEVRSHRQQQTDESLRAELTELRQRDLELTGMVERTRAKRDFLKGLVESFDGIPEGARHLMTSNEWRGRLQTTVGEVLNVEERLRIAIETALGETAGFIVVDTAEHAYRAIEYLKSADKGRATFVCLDRIGPRGAPGPAPAHGGVIGWATDLVSADPRYVNLVNFLLEGVLVVETVRDARDAIGQKSAVRCVTLEGEVVSEAGMVRGGSVRKDEGGHVGRKSQLEELSLELKHLEGLRSEVHAVIAQKQGQLQGSEVKTVAEEAKAIEQSMTAIEIRIAQLEFEKKRAAESAERGVQEIERLLQEIGHLGGEFNAIVPALTELEGRKSEAERNAGALAREVETMEALWNEHSRLTNEANVHVLSLKGEERSILQDIEHTAESIRTIIATHELRSQEIVTAGQEVVRLAHELEEIAAKIDAAKHELTALRSTKSELDEELGSKRSGVQEIERRLKDERAKHEGSLQSAHDLEIKVQELTMKSEALKARAREEFEVEIQLQSYDDNDTFDFQASRDTSHALKETLRGLGAVNFAAFDEYTSEKERLDFVNAQKKDLEESQKTLVETIDEINVTAQRQFLETFEKIRANFVSIFKGLFDEGDEADLSLEQEVDPLEARIEITAKPRGKRPTSIDLLSGGEKTLTAIALLFGIYLVKPSPFCILDEVDAPLDDTNIDRFTRILRRFSDNTQFVVVTHNKRTMESANALYGVTMEEEGVSKLVSVRFNESVVNG